MRGMGREACDILIIGAGLAGAATAHQVRLLSRAGQPPSSSSLRFGAEPRIILLEKEAMPGMHSSGRNAAFVRELMDEPLMQPLGTQGAEFLRRGELAEFRTCGLLLVGLGEEDVAKRFLSARGRAKWCPEEGIVDVATLLQAYLAGQEVRCGVEVLDWSPVGARLRVGSTGGEFECSVLVNAAGPWAGRVGRLPITPMRRHLVQTPPMSDIKPDWPFVWHAHDGLYFRPESGGLLLSPCDETPSEPGDYAEDSLVLEALADKVARLQPGLGELRVRNTWVGQRTFAPDRRFVVGFDPREPRLFHVAGLGGHGVTTSYAVGRLAAGMILTGTEPEQNPFSPGRLATFH